MAQTTLPPGAPPTDESQRGGLRVRVQKFGTALSNMVMPNIAAFIAWGLITAIFIQAGWVNLAAGYDSVADAVAYNSVLRYHIKGELPSSPFSNSYSHLRSPFPSSAVLLLLYNISLLAYRHELRPGKVFAGP